MKLGTRIYCIEGHWDYGKREVEPSVEPLLLFLRSIGQWDYARRNCATVGEMKYFLEREWERCSQGSILYITCHGDEGRIYLSDDEVLGLDTLAATVPDCSGCLIHFGGCGVLSMEKGNIRSFMEETGASAVSGYVEDVGWADTTFPPASALELMLFSTIAEDRIDLRDGRSAKRLIALATDLKKRFPECGFELYTRGSVGLKRTSRTAS